MATPKKTSLYRNGLKKRKSLHDRSDSWRETRERSHHGADSIQIRRSRSHSPKFRNSPDAPPGHRSVLSSSKTGSSHRSVFPLMNRSNSTAKDRSNSSLRRRSKSPSKGHRRSRSPLKTTNHRSNSSGRGRRKNSNSPSRSGSNSPSRGRSNSPSRGRSNSPSRSSSNSPSRSSGCGRRRSTSPRRRRRSRSKTRNGSGSKGSRSDSSRSSRSRVSRSDSSWSLKSDYSKPTSSVSSFYSGAPGLKSIMKAPSLIEKLNRRFHTSSQGLVTSMNLEDLHNRPRTICFTDVEIRSYVRTVGDNPSCSSGPPVTIGWEYDPNVFIMDTDTYEDQRPQRRRHLDLVLSRDARQHILKEEWHITQSQIAASVRANVKIKMQRRATVNNLHKLGRMEELLESAQRKIKRGLLFRKSTGTLVAEMDKQREKALKYQAARSAYSASYSGSILDDYMGGSKKNLSYQGSVPDDSGTGYQASILNDDYATVPRGVRKTKSYRVSMRDDYRVPTRKHTRSTKSSRF